MAARFRRLYTQVMTVSEALALRQLTQAIEIQEAALASDPEDPMQRVVLADLLFYAGRLEEVRALIAGIRGPDEKWSRIRRDLIKLLRAETRRTLKARKPLIYPEPAPRHCLRRRMAIRAMQRAQPRDAIRCIDAADAVTPEVRGFIDGQAIAGLRDADDRYASVLEVFRDGRYLWIPWESLQSVTLARPQVHLDELYRPATIALKGEPPFAAHLPLIYPNSTGVGDDHIAMGDETDYVCPDGGPTRCVGAKLLLIGNQDDIPLRHCNMIEIRHSHEL